MLLPIHVMRIPEGAHTDGEARPHGMPTYVKQSAIVGFPEILWIRLHCANP